MPWHCKPDQCPDKAKHASEMYRGRLTERYGVLTDQGALIILQVDGVDIALHYLGKWPRR